MFLSSHGYSWCKSDYMTKYRLWQCRFVLALPGLLSFKYLVKYLRGKIFLEIHITLYKAVKNGYNDNSQKIRKYLSSPKEASRSAKAAFLGASAMFMASFWGNLGCCQALKSARKKPVFIRISSFLLSFASMSKYIPPCLKGCIFVSRR